MQDGSEYEMSPDDMDVVLKQARGRVAAGAASGASYMGDSYMLAASVVIAEDNRYLLVKIERHLAALVGPTDEEESMPDPEPAE